MTHFEKGYCLFAIFFAFGIGTLLVAVPESRSTGILLPLCFCGLLVNVGLMYIVLKDIFTREELDKTKKLIWTGALLICWPAVLVYLPLHGFQKKTIPT
jgi:hypothetical protein